CRTEYVAWHGPVPACAPCTVSVSARPDRPAWAALVPVDTCLRPGGQNRAEAATASTFTRPEIPLMVNCQAGSTSWPRSVPNAPNPSLTLVTASRVDGVAPDACRAVRTPPARAAL